MSGAATRLRGRGRFAAVKARRLVVRTATVRVGAIENGLPHCRSGIAVVGVRHAVDRNRVRRRIRAALTPVTAPLFGADLVVTAGNDALAAPFTALQQDLERAVETAIQRLAAAAS